MVSDEEVDDGPPTSVHLSWDNTASISATFGHGVPQPPAGVATSMIGLSATEPAEGSVQRIDSGTAFADVEGLGQVECGEDVAGADHVADHTEIH